MNTTQTNMSNQHPLTDDVGRAIEEDLDLDWAMDCDEYMCMRAGPDWQLEQVIDWIESTLEAGDLISESLKKAMRPTTQENN
jgi:hypothetical protein